MFGEGIPHPFGGGGDEGGTVGTAVLAGTSTASFVGAAVASSAFSAQGTSTASFVSDVVPSFAMAGSSSAAFVGSRRFTARCAGAFTYDPVGGPAWEGVLRREPEIIVRAASNDSPSATTFTDEVDPQLGSDVQLDMGDGHGVIGAGVVQSKVMKYDGSIDELSYDATVADYLWLLNKRRPFGCYTKVSASVVAQDLMTKFAPHDFTSAIVPGLPEITVSFDGSLDFSGCMSVITSKISGYFKVDKNKVMRLFQEDPTPGPQVIDDDNMLLLRDQPFTVKTDISQLRNRVFVRGGSATLLKDTARGASTMMVEYRHRDGVSLFDKVGGYAIIGCDVFHYGGYDRTSDLAPQAGPPPDATYHLAQFGQAVVGPIKTNVRYSTALIVDGKEGPRSNVRAISPLRMGQGQTMYSGDPMAIFDAAGQVPAGPSAHTWQVGFRATDGSLLYDVQGSQLSGSPHPTPGRYRWNLTATFFSNELRPAEMVLWRLATIDGVSDYYEVDSVPIGSGNTPVVLEDVKDDASLGNRRPQSSGTLIFGQYDRVGTRVYLYGASLPWADAQMQGATSIKVYREEQHRDHITLGEAWTEPEVVMTIKTGPTINPNLELIEDTKSTTVFPYDLDEEEEDTDPKAPPKPDPNVQVVLRSVTGLDEAHAEGDEVFIWIQRDDLDSQLDMAEAEGGDGLHEYFVADTNLRSNAELAARGDAELELFSQPIVEARYSSFDPHEPGATVEFNLSNPPFVASLKILEVTIDKVHVEHGHVARYNVTASSVKFTLQDLLRRTVLRPY